MQRAFYALHTYIALLLVGVVQGKDRTDCLPTRYKPSNVTISRGIGVKPKVLVNGVEMELKGIGYSPIPPGKNTLDEQFDFFTGTTDYIWKRDIPIIAQMGANIVRTWSWDATLDHTGFLDACHKHNLMVLVPFGVTSIEYPDLADPNTRHQLITDWRAFLHKVRNHPALFGYMIGNELNEDYAGQFEELFSAVNEMVAVRDEVDPHNHPITMPFSDNNFMEDLVEKYYPWLQIDFWSLQIYRDEININAVSSEYSTLFLPPDFSSPKKGLFHNLTIKPLIFTEYGIDALDGDTCESWNRTCNEGEVNRLMKGEVPIALNETRQALGFCNRFLAIRNGTLNQSAYVNGGVIMEYVDEWWKGTFPDARRVECPNQRTDVHTYCASNINKNKNNTKPDFLHEEWLGLFEQIPAIAETYKLVQSMDYCIRPRLAQCVMGAVFSTSTGNASVDCLSVVQACNASFHESRPEHCASKRELWNNYIMIWIAPPLLILCCVICILHFYVKRGWSALARSFIFKSYGGDMRLVKSHNREHCEDEVDGVQENTKDYAQNGQPVQIHKNQMELLRGGLRQETIDKACEELRKEISDAFWKYTAGDTEANFFNNWSGQGNGEQKVLAFFTAPDGLQTRDCPHFKLAQGKILHSIRDHFMRLIMTEVNSHMGEDENLRCKSMMNKATRIMFEKYTEGYHLYVDAENPSKMSKERKDHISLLALYMIIQTWAGTINHAPEKVCELLEWSCRYFKAVEVEDRTERAAPGSWEAHAKRVADYHQGLVEIFRTYCLKVQEGFSFDDINSDSIYIRKKLREQNVTMATMQTENTYDVRLPHHGNNEAKEEQRNFVMGTEGDLLPEKSGIRHDKRKTAIYGTHLEYNSACKPEECVSSEGAKLFFTQRLGENYKSKQGPTLFFPKNIAFPLKGGVFSLILNFGWLIRYLVWQNMLASFLQPETVNTPMCTQKFIVTELGVADVSLCALFCFCHRVTLGRFKRRLWGEVAFYLPCFFLVWGTFIFDKFLDVSFICNYFSGACEGNKGIDIGWFTTDVPTIYLAVSLLYTIVDETRLFLWTYQTNAIKGRFKSLSQVRRVRIGYAVSCTLAIVGFIVLEALSLVSFELWSWWPGFDDNVPIVIFPVSIGIGYWFSGFLARSSSEYKHSARSDLEIKEESRYVALNIIFWGLFFVLNWMLAFYILVPAVNNVSLDLCTCSKAEYELDQTQVNNCKQKTQMMCYVGVVFVWISAYLVSFVFLYAVYISLLLVFGVARAKYIRVGNVQDWNDVERHWGTILKRSLPKVSGALVPKEAPKDKRIDDKRYIMTEGLSPQQVAVWNYFVESMFADNLLSKEERKAMLIAVKPENSAKSDETSEIKQLTPNFRVKPRSAEAQRRVTTFLWGLESLAAHNGHHEKAKLRGENPFTSDLRKAHRVYAMPSLTTIVPIYNEAILLTRKGIKSMRDPGTSSKRITELEYLSLVYPAEWQNFAQQMGEKHKGDWIIQGEKEMWANELLHAFTGQDHPKPLQDSDIELIREVELWATMRGQTLWRTVKGLCNIREGLEQLCILEETEMTPRQILELIDQKYQILISHQTFDMKKIGTAKGSLAVAENAMMHLFRNVWYLELVTNDDSAFQSHCFKLRKELTIPSGDCQYDPKNMAQSMAAIKKELQKNIDTQFDTLMRWQNDKLTPLEVGTMVRVNRDGVIKPRPGKEKVGGKGFDLLGGTWEEGVVTSFKRTARSVAELPLPAIEIKKKIDDYRSRNSVKGRAALAEATLGELMRAIGVTICPHDGKGVFFADHEEATSSKRLLRSRDQQGYSLIGCIVDDNKRATPNPECLDSILLGTGDIILELERFPSWGLENICEYKVCIDGKEESFPAEVVEPFPWTQQTVQRVSRLKIGEGKAENQIHALPFARGDVLQAMDMNQYATSDQGMKVPFLLNDFFSVPDAYTLERTVGQYGEQEQEKWDHNILIPPFRIVGFPEHCYTRDLSMVGELMGAAEWCFVTISQRVLSWPLRIRTHYGHPDFFDGYWARTRGGTSKASAKVNTNEDIFAGYEMLGRGERGSYVEFLEVHKGRETSFKNAYAFEAKLAQGAAQQIRSFDVYSLNRKLDLFSRFSLFYGSLAFYITNFVMAISINYYILSIVLFAMSDVTYHKLGLMDAIIAVPWLLQVGYILAIPMIVELIIQRGFLRGIINFVVTLPIAVFFFVFHMRTKTYYFGKGLLVGSGGYIATGRGFGLARMTMKEMYQNYSESHFIEGLLIFICLIMYAVYGSDPFVPYLARTFTIILISMSWLWAPAIFNPMPTMQELQNDLSTMMDWLSTKMRSCTEHDASKMLACLEAVQDAKKINFYKENFDPERQEEPASGYTTDGSTRSVNKDAWSAEKPDFMEWYKKLIFEDGEASFTWKRIEGGNPKKLVKGPIPDLDSRCRELVVLLSSVENMGQEAFTTNLCAELSLSPTDVEYDDWKPGNETLGVIRLKTKKMVEDLGPNFPREIRINDKEGIPTYGTVYRFSDWAETAIPTFSSYEEMVSQYWVTEDGKRNTSEESWKAWYLQRVVFELWQSEDDHAKTPVQYSMATAIKFYLHAEFYLPWALIAFAYWNMESMWLLGVGLFLAWLFKFIDFNTKDQHDLPQLIKATTLFLIPSSWMYYKHSIITSKELFWSCVFYMLCVTTVLRIWVGGHNLRARGWLSSVYTEQKQSAKNDPEDVAKIVKGRWEDLDRIGETEKKKATIFKNRLLIGQWSYAFRAVTPFCIMVLLTLGNFLTAIMSTTMTALMYNGSIAEAWRKAYFSSTSSILPPTDSAPAAVVVTAEPTSAALQTEDAFSTSLPVKKKKKTAPALKEEKPTEANPAPSHSIQEPQGAGHLSSDEDVCD